MLPVTSGAKCNRPVFSHARGRLTAGQFVEISEDDPSAYAADQTDGASLQVGLEDAFACARMRPYYIIRLGGHAVAYAK